MLTCFNVYPLLIRPNIKHISRPRAGLVMKKFDYSNAKPDTLYASEIFSEVADKYKYLFIDRANELVYLFQEKPTAIKGIPQSPMTSTLTIKTNRVFYLQRNTIYVKD